MATADDRIKRFRSGTPTTREEESRVRAPGLKTVVSPDPLSRIKVYREERPKKEEPQAPQPEEQKKEGGFQRFGKAIAKVATQAVGYASAAFEEAFNFAARNVPEIATKASQYLFRPLKTKEQIAWENNLVNDYQKTFDRLKESGTTSIEIADNIRVPFLPNILPKGTLALERATEALQPKWKGEWASAPLREKMTSRFFQTAEIVGSGVVSSLLSVLATKKVTGSMLAGTSTLGLSTARDVSIGARENGVDQQTSDYLGMAVAVPVTILEKFGYEQLLGKGIIKNWGLTFFNKVIGQKLGGVASRVVTSGAVETLTELSQEEIQIAAESSFREVGADERVTRDAMATLGGALSGLFIGGSTAAWDIRGQDVDTKQKTPTMKFQNDTIRIQPALQSSTAGISIVEDTRGTLKNINGTGLDALAKLDGNTIYLSPEVTSDPDVRQQSLEYYVNHELAHRFYQNNVVGTENEKAMNKLYSDYMATVPKELQAPFFAKFYKPGEMFVRIMAGNAHVTPEVEAFVHKVAGKPSFEVKNIESFNPNIAPVKFEDTELNLNTPKPSEIREGMKQPSPSIAVTAQEIDAERLDNFEASNAQTIIERVIGGDNKKVQVQTVKLDNGQFSVAVRADTDTTSFTRPFADLFPTQEAALTAGIDSLLNFVQQQRSTVTPTAQTENQLRTIENEVVKFRQRATVQTAQEFSGRAFRADTGFQAGGTALDVINFEADDLGNEHVRQQALAAARAVGVDLANVPAQGIMWVTRTRDDASRFGDQIRELNFPVGSIALADLGSDGVLVLPKESIDEAKEPKTQKEKVKQVVEGEEKTAKEIAEETGILEPNVRRILGVGAKEGTFERIGKGVYTLKVGDQNVAYVEAADALETLPRLVDEGVKFDMVFLDPPYTTTAIRSGNRAIKFDLITPTQFGEAMDAVAKLVKDDDTPVYYMFSQAPSGAQEMERYNQKLFDAGFKVVARGDFTKLTKQGEEATNVRSVKAHPEGILLLTKSGNFTEKELPRNLDFKLIRAPVAGKEGRQTQKPAALLRSLILQGTSEGDFVLDPFAGTGVAGAEAVRAGRRTYVIEKDVAAIEKFIKPRIEQAAKETKATRPKKQSLSSLGIIPAEMVSYIEQNTLAASLDKAKAGDLKKALIASKSFVLDPTGGQLLSKFGRAESGISQDVFEMKPELDAGYHTGVITDSYQLIIDSKIAREYFDAYFDRQAKRVARNAPNPKEALAEAKKNMVERAQANVKDFPNIEPIMPKEEGTVATVQGYYSSNNTIYAVLTDGKQQVASSADRLAFMVKTLPDAEIRITGPEQVIQFRRDGKVVGLLMPVRIGETEIPFSPKQKTIVAPKRGAKGADVDLFVEGNEVKLGGVDQVRPIEFPELVALARELSGNEAWVRRFRRQTVVDADAGTAVEVPIKYGFFSPKKKAIALDVSLFETGNEEQLAKTMAHEIGHLVDFLPDETTKRGNMLGHLNTMRGFMRGTFSNVENEEKIDGLVNELDTARQTRQSLKNDQGEVTDKALNSQLYRRIVEINKEVAKLQENSIKDSDIRTELWNLSTYWRPLSDQASETYLQYRKGADELYADAVSVLFNSPGTLQRMAPKFYEAFFQSLDRKPDVKTAYFDLQSFLTGDREAIVARRREGLQQMFREGDMAARDVQEKRMREKEDRNRNIFSRFKHEVVSLNYTMIERVNKLKKAGTFINPDDNPVFALEERNYLGGKIKSTFEQHFQPVYKTLTENSIDWHQFGEYMFTKRIVDGDRSDLANPRGISPKDAAEILESIKAEQGPGRYALMDRQAQAFRTGMKQIAEDAFKEGLYSAELYAQMQTNPSYVTFQVIEHIEEGVTAKVHRQVGTLKDITNPANASLLKMIETIKAIERNRVTKGVVAFLAKHYPGDIKKAKTRFTGKAVVPVESRLPNEELIMFRENGKLVGFYVDPYIKQTVDRNTVGQNNVFIGSIRFLNGRLFRPLFITFNLGFQSFNLVRDFTRFWKNVPNMSLFRAAKQYARAMPAAKARGFGGTGEGLELIKRMEREQVLSFTFNDMILGRSIEDEQIDAIMQRVGVSEGTEVPRPKVVRPLFSVLEFIKKLGDTIESISKVAGFYELVVDAEEAGRKTPFTPKEARSFIRRKVGSPDFLDKGHITPATNELFLFSNAIIQGIRADIEVATDPRTRSGFWWKTAMRSVAPKMLMFAALYGLFGDRARELMQQATEYDKTNYSIVPLGKDPESGKTVYLRIPEDETGRLIGGLVWKAMTMFQNKQSLGKDLTDIASYTGGQIPSISPAIESVINAAQFLAGQNPYDFFRGRNILTDDQHQAGGWDAAKPFLLWQFNQFGGSVFMRFYTGETAPRESSGLERFLQTPMLSNVIGRFIRVTDYGELEQYRQIIGEQDSADARRRISENRIVNDYIGKWQESDQTDERRDQYVKDIQRDILGTAERGSMDESQKSRATNLERKFRLGIARGMNDPKISALIDAGTNDLKVKILTGLRGVMDEADFEKLLADAKEYKVISDEVIKKVKE